MPLLVNLPTWITLDGIPGGIAELAPKIETYAKLAEHWLEIAAAIDKLGKGAPPLDSPIKLAVYVVNAVDDDAVVEVFTALGLDGLHGDLVKFKADLDDEKKPWAKLLKPMSDFMPATTIAEDIFAFDDENPAGLLELKVPQLAGAATGNAGPVALTFDVSASGGLQSEAGSKWPFGGDDGAPRLLRIGGSGTARSKAGLSVPIGQLGSGSANAGASIQAAMHYFFRPADVSQPFAQVLLDSLTGVASPLDLAAIGRAVDSAGLEGVVLGWDGAVDAGLRIVLGKSYEIPKIAAGTIGLTAELSFKRSTRWVLSLRRIDDGMRFVLSHDEGSERNWGIGVGIEIDAAPLARRVHDLLSKVDEATGSYLNQIRPFLSPGTYIAEKAQDLLRTTVEPIVEQDDIREALIDDLSLGLGEGDGATVKLIDLFEKKISDLAATQSKGILADVETWSTTIVDGLVAQVPALAATGIADQLKAKIKPMLAEVQGRFDTLLKSLTANEQDTAKLAKELAAVGAKIKAAEDRADKVLAGVRAVVEQFDKFSKDVLAATSDSANSKIKARFGWSGGSASGVEHELVGTFAKIDPADTAAAALQQELWSDLFAGRMQRFQKMLGDPLSAPAGVSLSPESRLTRFASTQHGFSAELVILGMDLSMTAIVTGKASVSVNGVGDVIVAAEGSALRKGNKRGESRSVRFINSWDLLLAKLSETGDKRAMSVSVGFDHNDKDLTGGDVQGVLEGLKKQKLITGARVDAAVDRYKAWQGVHKEAKIRGSISLKMALPNSAVERMIALGHELAKPGNEVRRTIFRLAVHAQVATDAGAIKIDVEDARDIISEDLPADPVALIVILKDQDVFKKLRAEDADINNHGQQNLVDQIKSLEKVILRADKFIAMLVTMAAIYEAVPVDVAGGTWTEKHYADAEEDLASAAGDWLLLNSGFLTFKDELDSALLAFLRLLALMTRPALPGKPADGLDGDPDTAVTDGLFLIGMALGEEAAKPV